MPETEDGGWILDDRTVSKLSNDMVENLKKTVEEYQENPDLVVDE